MKCLHALGLSKADIDTEENDPSSTKQNSVSEHIADTDTIFWLSLTLSLSFSLPLSLSPSRKDLLKDPAQYFLVTKYSLENQAHNDLGGNLLNLDFLDFSSMK